MGHFTEVWLKGPKWVNGGWIVIETAERSLPLQIYSLSSTRFRNFNGFRPLRGLGYLRGFGAGFAGLQFVASLMGLE